MGAGRATDAWLRRSPHSGARIGPRCTKLVRVPRLRREVESLLEHRWSPQQISKRLAVEFPEDPEMRISHETIYQSLFVQARGALRRDLAARLRSGRTQRRPQGRTRERVASKTW
jgi:IS30 family transposase